MELKLKTPFSPDHSIIERMIAKIDVAALSDRLPECFYLNADEYRSMLIVGNAQGLWKYDDATQEGLKFSVTIQQVPVYER